TKAKELAAVTGLEAEFDLTLIADEIMDVTVRTMLTEAYTERYNLDDVDFRFLMISMYPDMWGRNDNLHPIKEAIKGGGRDLLPMLYPAGDAPKGEKRVLGSISFGDIDNRIKE